MLLHLPLNHKFISLEKQIGRSTAVGSLELIWHLTATNAPEGDIGKISDQAIESYAGWEGKPGELIEILVELGFLDISPRYRLIIHNWHLHAPNWLKGKLKKQKRKIINPKERPEEKCKVITKDDVGEGRVEEGRVEPLRVAREKTEPAIWLDIARDYWEMVAAAFAACGQSITEPRRISVWARSLRLLHEQDGQRWENAQEVLKDTLARTGCFEMRYCVSPEQFRKHFSKLQAAVIDSANKKPPKSFQQQQREQNARAAAEISALLGEDSEDVEIFDVTTTNRERNAEAPEESNGNCKSALGFVRKDRNA